jgi:hypothetical protein
MLVYLTDVRGERVVIIQVPQQGSCYKPAVNDCTISVPCSCS